MEIEKDFIDLLTEYKALIYKVCFMYASNQEDLNDLYQEVVVNLWCSYPKFRYESKLSTWIYRVALNTCISDLRKKKVLDYVPLSVDIGVYDDCLRNDSLKEMYQLICQLDRYERMLVLLWLDENSYDEIASITGSNRNTVAVKLHRIKDKLKKKDHCIIAVSEGIRDQYGMCVSLDSGIQKDAFGHLSNNGCSNYLKKLIGDHLGCKVRAIQLSTLQRCAAHLASYIDIENALRIGSYAINCALDKRTGIMVTISKNRNEFLLSHVDIHKVANHVKPFPLEWIDEKNKKIKKEYIDYVVPLIYKSGQIELPQYLQLNER